MTQKLKRKITDRWYDIQSDPKAYAQLEYILIEAGLLAQRRTPSRPRDRKMEAFSEAVKRNSQ